VERAWNKEQGGPALDTSVRERWMQMVMFEFFRSARQMLLAIETSLVSGLSRRATGPAQ
jgi:hypothetical protein